MNYLAHSFLSFGQEQVLAGNFIGDFIKGKTLQDYPEGIQCGILLHREIDTFTDSHPLVRAGQSYLKPTFGRYSTVITDIYFDYFLAKNWDLYSEQSLEEFIQQTYRIIQKYRDILPERFLRMFGYMREQNWLLHYREKEGIQRSLTGLSKRTRFESKMELAHLALSEFEAEFELIFFAFFRELSSFAQVKLQKIQASYGPH